KFASSADVVPLIVAVPGLAGLYCDNGIKFPALQQLRRRLLSGDRVRHGKGEAVRDVKVAARILKTRMRAVLRKEINRALCGATLGRIGIVVTEIPAELDRMIATQIGNVIYQMMYAIGTKPVGPARAASQLVKSLDPNNRQRTNGRHAGVNSVGRRRQVRIDLIAFPVHEHVTNA